MLLLLVEMFAYFIFIVRRATRNSPIIHRLLAFANQSELTMSSQDIGGKFLPETAKMALRTNSRTLKVKLLSPRLTESLLTGMKTLFLVNTHSCLEVHLKAVKQFH